MIIDDACRTTSWPAQPSHRVKGWTALADILASEVMKLRTLRATALVLACAVLAMVMGSLVVLAVVHAYDAAPPAQQSSFEAADPTVVVMPFVAFFVASLGALAVTSEYTTGTMISSLISVPCRRVLLTAKAIVVAAVTLLGGMAFSFVSFGLALVILGDRPAPINPWTSLSDALPTVLAVGLAIMVAGLVALGLGTVLRSTTGTVVTMSALLLVMPIFGHFLPSPWGQWVSSLMLSNLAPQLAGVSSAYVLSPLAALTMMAAYVLCALTAAALTISKRDA